MNKSKSPDPVDIYVGQAVRRWRKKRGWTQTRLATALGISYQQLQKYENAKNRITASRLLKISLFLDVPFEAFMPGEGALN